MRKLILLGTFASMPAHAFGETSCKLQIGLGVLRCMSQCRAGRSALQIVSLRRSAPRIAGVRVSPFRRMRRGPPLLAAVRSGADVWIRYRQPRSLTWRFGLREHLLLFNARAQLRVQGARGVGPVEEGRDELLLFIPQPAPCLKSRGDFLRGLSRGRLPYAKA